MHPSVPWHARERPPARSTSFDLGDVFAEAVRQAMCGARGKRLAYAFDCQDGATLSADRTALSCALHRLLCGAIDVLDNGLLVFHAKVRPLRAGRLLTHLQIGGSGVLAPEPAIDEVLSRLCLTETSREAHGGAARLRRAQGTCPATRGQVEFASLASAGVLLTYEQVFAGDVSPPQELECDAGAARAWVVDADEVAAQSLACRLQRLGWATITFAQVAQALRRLRSMPAGQARPALIVLQESDTATAGDARILAALLPPQARCVLAVSAGSHALLRDPSQSEVDVHVAPFSPADLRQLTAALAPGADTASGATRPAPLLLKQRPSLLVVDDNELNRIVAAGLAESLGYTVRLACDGVEALDACFDAPPGVVLMDLSMPRMDGIEATRHLRRMQRSGAMPPFPVIAATADATEQSRQRCLDAGMDAVLHKPLLRPALQGELQRLCTGNQAGCG